ncbi:MAG TPA: butanediol dehydrogenase, partial [Microbacterium sp.]|nr:butanediol dehydrogenase [Microbacterium sp.]
MRAAFIDSKESIRIAELETPQPTDDQVRVRIDYVGI